MQMQAWADSRSGSITTSNIAMLLHLCNKLVLKLVWNRWLVDKSSSDRA